MGGNREATRLSGISLNRAMISVFALSGLLAGIAAVVNISRTGIAAYDAGNSYELYAVAATVIGGTSLFGGQGGIPGTIIGALLMFTIRNGCALQQRQPQFRARHHRGRRDSGRFVRPVGARPQTGERIDPL